MPANAPAKETERDKFQRCVEETIQEDMDVRMGGEERLAFWAWASREQRDAALVAAYRRSVAAGDAFDAFERDQYGRLAAVAEEVVAALPDRRCPVCWEVIVTPYVTRCGHAFCLACVRKLPVRGRVVLLASCPICRADVQEPAPGPEALVWSAWNALSVETERIFRAWRGNLAPPARPAPAQPASTAP